MNNEQLERGNQITQRISSLQIEKEGWERALRVHGQLYGRDSKIQISFGGYCRPVEVNLNEEQFKLLRYMKLQELSHRNPNRIT